jgi:hypothetical protein
MTDGRNAPMDDDGLIAKPGQPRRIHGVIDPHGVYGVIWTTTQPAPPLPWWRRWWARIRRRGHG